MPQITFPLTCACCGHALGPTHTAELCPACRTPIAQTLGQFGVDTETLAVNADVVCLGCGYNLRTISAGGVCPECAKPVADSLLGDELRHADANWLQRVRSGTTLLIWSFFLSIGAWIAAIALAEQVAPSTGFGVAYIIQTLGFLGVYALFCVGLFKATADDPSAPAGQYRPTFRRLARVCAVLPVPIFVATMVLAAYYSSGATQVVNAAVIATMLTSALSGLFMSLAAVGLFVCIRRIFVRARRRPLTLLASMFIALLVVTPVLMLAGQVLLVLALRGLVATGITPVTTASVTATAPATMPAVMPKASLMLVGGGMACVGSLLMVGCVVLGLVLLFKCRAVLGEMLRARSLDQPG